MDKSRRWNVWLLALLFTAWLLPGVIGRHPWKADEAYSFGLVLNIVETGDWVIPTLGGEPFMEKPPVMYIVGALTAKLFSPLLSLHDAARLSVIIFNLLTFLFLGLGAREIYGPGKGWLAPVLLMGCLGPIHNAHMLVTDMALLTGFAMGLYGLLVSARRPWLGGFAAGTGIGIAFLAKGLLGPGLLGLTTLLLPVCFRPWRTRAYFDTLLALTLAAMPWVLIWPLMVYQRSPDLFYEWFWVNNFGRFLGTNKLGPSNSSFYYFKLLPWFALPAFPLALWYWWQNRIELWRNRSYECGLLAFAVMIGVLSVAQTGRSLYAQPMLVPLVLAGTGAIANMSGSLAKWIFRITATIFSVLILGAWLGWLGLMVQAPASLWNKVHAQVPNYVPQFLPHLFVFALAGTVAFFWLIRKSKREGADIVVNWTAAVACVYLLAMTLFLPVAESNNCYRPVFEPLRDTAILPTDQSIASYGLGEPQRAMLHYYSGLKSTRVEVQTNAFDRSLYVLIQGNYRDETRMGPPEPGRWQQLWEARHGGRESFRLYRKIQER